ncbi:MAG: metallophosphoesterase [Deltaproteobacteria bacterium]|nr:metallophosphoesterase [Deltaproteobacteria bacterium]
MKPDRLYRYQLDARFAEENEFHRVVEDSFRTQRSEVAPFSFALISDAHITPFTKDRTQVLSQVCAAIGARQPEFLLMLGDNIQTFTSHGGPMAEESFGALLYSHLRNGLGRLPASVPVFTVLGNWEGENGWHPARERAWAKKARMTFLPNPGPETYPEGGSENQDYYGFSWGNTLFLILNVTGYTTNDHAHGSPVGKADDWTLGRQQKTWLLERLSNSKARWKLIFIHHTAGGKAGDDLNSRYGRGGGRAAHIGEQAGIHQWMRRYGVQALFYGHDHVFTDMAVDGIHYICVGSAGAPWKFTESETGYNRFWTPSGYTWVDVDQKALKVSFIEPRSAGGGENILHSFEITSK